jgi:hypothetical protein
LPFNASGEVREANLNSMTRDGNKVFALSEGRGAWTYRHLNGINLVDQGAEFRANLPANLIITDDNRHFDRKR